MFIFRWLKIIGYALFALLITAGIIASVYLAYIMAIVVGVVLIFGGIFLIIYLWMTEEDP